MMSLEKALAQREAEHRPIRIGLVGAGYMGRGVALKLCTPLTGMRLVAIANRHIETAQRAWAIAGAPQPVVANKQADLDNAIQHNQPVVTSDANLLCRADGIDVLIDATSDAEFGAHTALAAIAGRKHYVSMNAALDATLGPILMLWADSAGVVFTSADGDEPAIALNLLRHVQSIGLKPVMAGNFKGFLDRHRTPETQQGFAEKTGMNPVMCAEYADGTKLNFEACMLANATGFKIARRGMHGPACRNVKQIVDQMNSCGIMPQQLLDQPLIDYVLGDELGPGVFVIAHCDHPVEQQYLSYLKMGSGPLYVFYRPHVLPHLEPALSAARAALLGEATIAPLGGPVCEVITVAKRPLQAGETLDGSGGFAAYGLIENCEVARRENLLPIALSGGCRLLHDLQRDSSISLADVELPPNRLIDRLYWEQQRHFFPQAASSHRNGLSDSQPLASKSSNTVSHPVVVGVGQSKRRGAVTVVDPLSGK
jgi:predicted homoserine dehydrogenase-like protein